MSVAHLNKLEAGLRAPNLTTLEALASALRVRVADLFADEPEPVGAPAPSRAWLALVQALREKDADYLRALAGVMRAMDRAVEGARPPDRRGRRS